MKFVDVLVGTVRMLVWEYELFVLREIYVTCYIKTWNEFIKNILKYVLFDCMLLVMYHMYQLLVLIKLCVITI